MEVKGKVKVVNATVVVSEKFQKREFVVTVEDGMYPQDILFQLTQDKVSLADSLGLLQDVTVHYNLRGREWTSATGEVKYFNTLEAWKIDSNGAF
jgi:single-strand DNA-binding protein